MAKDAWNFPAPYLPKWQPMDRLGMSVVLREECNGSEWARLYRLFIDGIILAGEM